jgi:hypothetical protein
MNLFVSLPAPAANAAGAWVDVSALGRVKSITVSGNPGPFQPVVRIECSNELVPTHAYPILTFPNPDTQTFQVACHWMRAVVSNYQGGGASTVDIGSQDEGTSFAQLPVPAGTGVGAGISTAALGVFKTIQIGGAFGGTIQIEISEDGGATYNAISSFQAPGSESALFIADFMRVRRTGVPPLNPGLPDVWIAASNASGTGPPGPGVPPKLYTVYVGKNGNDGTADGSIGKPFLTVQAAMEFAWTTYVLPVEPQPVSPFRRPCVYVNAGTYDDGPLVLPPQICVMGEGFNHSRIVGNWTIDARWSNYVPASLPSPPSVLVPSDMRSSWINVGLFGTVSFDFNTVFSNEGKIYALGCRFGNTVTIAEKRVNPVSNSVTFTACEFLSDLTLIGIPALLEGCVTKGGTLFITQAIGSNPADVDNIFESSGGSIGNIVITSLNGVMPAYSCTFAHLAQPDTTLTLNGTFSLIKADLGGVPLQSLVVLAGGANLNQIFRINQLNWSGVTLDRPAGPYVGQQYFDVTLTRPIWWDGAAWITWPTISGDSALLFFGAATIAAAADTRFIPPGRIDSGVAATVDVYQLPVPRAGTVKSLVVRHNSPPGNGNPVVYTVMKNGVATLLTATLATGAVGQASDLVNTVAVVLGDRISLRATKALGIGASGVDVDASVEVV